MTLKGQEAHLPHVLGGGFFAYGDSQFKVKQTRVINEMENKWVVLINFPHS